MNRQPRDLARIDHWRRRTMRAAGIVALITVLCAVTWKAGYTPMLPWSEPVSPQATLDAGPIPTVDAAPKVATLHESEQPDLLSATQVSIEPEPRRLLLIATSPGPSPRQGMARIGTDLRAPQTYAAGAILLNGAKLAEIHHRFVVLEREGEKFRLSIGGDAGPGSEQSGLALVGGEQPATPRPQLAVDRLSEIIRLSPVYENDFLVGMQIYPGRRSDVFSNLGLKSGDLVVAIEGSPIADAAGMSQSLMASP
jgi:hypothetical protein